MITWTASISDNKLTLTTPAGYRGGIAARIVHTPNPVGHDGWTVTYAEPGPLARFAGEERLTYRTPAEAMAAVAVAAELAARR